MGGDLRAGHVSGKICGLWVYQVLLSYSACTQDSSQGNSATGEVSQAPLPAGVGSETAIPEVSTTRSWQQRERERERERERVYSGVDSSRFPQGPV